MQLRSRRRKAELRDFAGKCSFGGVLFLFFPQKKNLWVTLVQYPGDSKCPFHPLVGGHVFTPWKGHVFTIPKRSRLESPGRSYAIQNVPAANQVWFAKCLILFSHSFTAPAVKKYFPEGDSILGHPVGSDNCQKEPRNNKKDHQKHIKMNPPFTVESKWKNVSAGKLPTKKSDFEVGKPLGSLEILGGSW